MDKNTDKFDDDLIMPERDELRSHGKKQSRGSSAQPVRKAGKAGASGPVRFLLTILVLGLFGTAGAGYFFYMQGQDMLNELDRAGTRILQLESRLSLTDEAAQQSSLGFLEKVEFNFSEIDKLWAARNQNRSDIADLTNKTDEQAKTFAAIEKVISGQSVSLNENKTLLNNVETRVEAMNANLAGMNSLNLGQQLERINADLASLQAAVSTQDVGLSGRVESNEQDIESINIFRLQLNQRINSIQSSINNLQQQVGGQ